MVMATVFAVAAHPDDIEFGMAGTLFLLQRAGCVIHYMNIANGSCGSAVLNAEDIAEIRLRESRDAAGVIPAVFHPPIAGDLHIFYEDALLSRLASKIREIAPDILLVPSPDDYMEDHMIACRLAVTAAFARGMRNFEVDPPLEPIANEIVVYHAQPYGNRDYLDNLVAPDFCIDITAVMDKKKRMLASHKSQKEWLDESQGIDSYLDTMEQHAAEIGKVSGRYGYAEGWRRHNPLGLCTPGTDSLQILLAESCMTLVP